MPTVRKMSLFVATGIMVIGAFAPVANASALDISLADSGIWNYTTGANSGLPAACDIATYTAMINPDLRLTSSAKSALAQLQRRADRLIDQISIRSGIARNIIEQYVNQMIAATVAGASNVEAAIDQLLAETRATLVQTVENIAYVREYDPSVSTNAYAAAYAKATQDASDWQAEVDAYEAPGGVVDQIRQAATAADDAYNGIGNTTVKNAIASALGIPAGGISADWIISNATSLNGTLGSLNCNLFALVGLSGTCNGIKSSIQVVLGNLSDYQDYKDLLANPPTDPAAYAAQKASEADATEQARARAVAQTEATMAGLVFDQAINSIKGLIQNTINSIEQYINNVVIPELKSLLSITEAEARALLAAMLGLTNTATPVNLEFTTTLSDGTVVGTGVVRSLTIRDLVDTLLGRKDLGSYVVTLSASNFNGGSAYLSHTVKLTLGAHTIKLGASGGIVNSQAGTCAGSLKSPITGFGGATTYDNSTSIAPKLVVAPVISVTLVAGAVGARRFIRPVK
ncbi:MAG: hypothetical protein LBG75_03670 [Candidatus Nomurabacteria bacterium]|jgi:hypothetical protein|nr:hypothetical protein [Candidatus Nomurabacteria bacterium]